MFRGITVGSKRRKIGSGVPNSPLQSFKGKNEKVIFLWHHISHNSRVKENPNVYVQLFLACIFIHRFCWDTCEGQNWVYVSSSMQASVLSLPRLLSQVSDTQHVTQIQGPSKMALMFSAKAEGKMQSKFRLCSL